MTDEEIIAIRKQSLDVDYSQPWADTLAFAHSLIAATREQVIEECAKVCEGEFTNEADDEGAYYNDGCTDCATAIRALTRPPGDEG